MKNFKLIIIIVAAVLAVIVFGIFAVQGFQNTAISLEEQVETAESDIRVQEGGIIGGLGSLLAFYLSFPLGWHLGATIILVLGVIFCTAYLYSSRCGRLKQRGKNSSQVQ